MHLAAKSERYRIFLVLACVVIAAGCASFGKQSAAPEIRPDRVAGYLAPGALPNSVAILPPPPAEGSAAQAIDDEIARKTRALHGGPRWALAAEDDDLTFPSAAGALSCALGAPITEEATPRLYILLRRSLIDAARSTYAAKDHYKRARPFMVNKAPTCVPDAQRERLAKSPSYPSGHTTLGWTWALILAEVSPERATEILMRGRAFGQSRVICNVHWQSDVDAATVTAAATVALLHTDPVFRADLEAAKAEVASARARGLKPTRDCAAEAATLGQ